ncbi:hypothetical protein [Bacillus mycoides]|uniref:hypothetical protein n=1 Tax=Bacillus mycoides TaxID=1405 RepID=UPI003D6500DF
MAMLPYPYPDKDFLDSPNEKIISETMSVDETVKMIISDIGTISKASDGHFHL